MKAKPPVARTPDPRRLRSVAAAAALSMALAAAGSALAAPAWVTVGERAHALLLQAAPAAQQLLSRQMQVNRPVAPGGRQLVPGSETVYAMQVDEDALPALSDAVHEQLRQCGGFVRHDSAADALAALHRLQGTPSASRAPAFTIDDQAQVDAMLPQLQASNLLGTIESLAAFQNRRHTSSHGVAASNWLFTQWSQMAPSRRDVRVTQIAHTGFAQKSVMLEILGGSRSQEVIVLGGHLDSTASGNAETVRAPGADDDASGIAALNEVIRVLIANGYMPDRTLRFIAYAGEEAGLLGSRQIVAALPSQRTTVVGVMQLDMTAYQGSPIDVWMTSDYTDPAQNQFVVDLAAAYLPLLTVGFEACGYACSDHAAWYNAGYAVSYPFESRSSTSNPRIHTPNDTTAVFGNQANHALKFTQLALSYMVELGSDGP